MLEQFSMIKNLILQQADKIKASKSVDKTVLENSGLEADIDNLVNGEFKIALIAPFSAGKSTFINSLIGNDLLSMEITAETSVITKVKFSEDIKLEIVYREANRIEIIDKDESGNSLSEGYLKKILELKTTVKGENTEEMIKEVIVHYPIEMCKDNVELVDTPGLFARHEKHEAITSSILPNVNAVIFMIDPDSVGEEHFMDVIQNYVRNAKNSNMEEEGKHIFFVINKIDVFEPYDIELAKNELRTVLEGIIQDPQVFEISAYYGMKGKMYLSGALELIDIQKDRKIKIEDPEDPGFTISGRQITEENVGEVLETSKIKDLEKGLESYLQNKNMYLITNLQNKVEDIIKQSIEKIKFERDSIVESYNVDLNKYEEQLEKLDGEIEGLQDDYIRKINYFLDQSLKGGTSGNASILTNIEYKIESETDKKRKELYVLSNKTWRNAKVGLNKNNAEEKLNSYTGAILDEISIYSKEIARETFIEIKSEIDNLVNEVRVKLDKIKEDIESAELKNIGKKIDSIGNFNMDSVLSNISADIERDFSFTVSQLSNEALDKIDEAEENATYEEEKKGIFYGFKKFFTGRREYVTKFDDREFKIEIDNIAEEFREKTEQGFSDIAESLKEKSSNTVNNSKNELKKQSNAVVDNVIRIKKALIETTIKEMKKSEKDKQVLIKEKELAIKENIQLLNQFLKIIDEIGDEVA